MTKTERVKNVLARELIDDGRLNLSFGRGFAWEYRQQWFHDHYGASEGTVRLALAQLEDEGFCRKVGHSRSGRWEIVTDGERQNREACRSLADLAEATAGLINRKVGRDAAKGGARILSPLFTDDPGISWQITIRGSDEESLKDLALLLDLQGE